MPVYRVEFKTVPPKLIELPRLVCAWCNCIMREGQAVLEKTSHGICKDCLNKEKEKLKGRVK